MKTTLNKIRAHNPCTSGWKKLLTNLGKNKADDDPLLLTTILESNGMDDAAWCLRAVDGHDREIRLFSVACARRVQHLMTDNRSLDALDVAERFADGLATQSELAAAWDAAWDAAGTASRDAAGAAAWTAAWTASRDAAWDASGAASRDAAWDAQAVLFILMCEGAL